MNQPLKLIEERHKRGVTSFSSLFSRLSCTYCYLLQDIFTAEMALLHFSVPLIHRPHNELVVAHQTILHDREHPSYVMLPVVPRG